MFRNIFITRNIFPFLLCIILLVSCSSKMKDNEKNAHYSSELPTITIGSKPFTEQYILMTMTSLLLRDNGYKVNEIRFLDTPTIRSAIEEKFIDMYWEYTNTARIIFHKQPPIFDPAEAYLSVQEHDKRDHLLWLEKSEFYSNWAIIIKKSFAEKNQLTTISDLISYMEERNVPLKFATSDDFLSRADGLNHLQNVYNFTLNDNQILPVDWDLLTLAVKESRVAVSIGVTSDSRISDYDLIILDDDLQAFPPYHAVPVVIQELIEEYPTIKILLNQLSNSISEQEMIGLNYQVEVLQNDVIKVARTFLIEKGLLEIN